MKHLMIGLCSLSLLAGCGSTGSKETAGTLLGAAAGGLIGSQFGHGGGRVAGALIGAAAGGLAGNYIGSEMDKDDRKK
jgi:uncharacterized protein YcfJ